MKYNECPECDGRLKTVLATNRLNKQLCENCWWEGEPFVPETKEVTGVRKISDHLSSCYEIFDKYGQCIVCSIRQRSHEEGRAELMRELEYYNNKYNSEQGGPFTGVLWPDKIEVVGEVFR